MSVALLLYHRSSTRVPASKRQICWSTRVYDLYSQAGSSIGNNTICGRLVFARRLGIILYIQQLLCPLLCTHTRPSFFSQTSLSDFVDFSPSPSRLVAVACTYSIYMIHMILVAGVEHGRRCGHARNQDRRTFPRCTRQERGFV